MRLLITLLCVLSAALAAAQSPAGPVLSDDQVNEAIALGLRGSKFTPVNCKAYVAGNQGFHVEAMGPANRIRAAAIEARSKYLGFAPANVSDSMRALTVSVTAMPLREVAMPGATHIALKSKPSAGQAPMVLQPLGYQIRPTGWGNRKSAGISATFDLGALRAAPHKDIDVVTITAGGEARCKLSADKLRRIE